MEAIQRRNGEATDLDTMMLFGGVAMLVFGAGLLLSNRTVRQYLGQVRVGDVIGSSVPDLEKYMKLRAM
jgi:hypothetical protein